jgi:hypothetical protein
MNIITFFHSVVLFFLGLGIFPLFIKIVEIYKKFQHLKKEQDRIKNTTFLLSGVISNKERLLSHVCSLCQLKRQGVLHIIVGRRRGYILFRNGQIIDGFYRNLFGIDGIEDILSLEDGEYFFESRAITQLQLIDNISDNLSQLKCCDKREETP